MSLPAFVALVSLFTGGGLIVGGIYILAGIGWAMIASAAPLLLLAVVLFRGLNG